MRNNRIRAGFFLSYTAIFIQSIISLLYTPFLIRCLGETDYGLLQLAVSTIANLSILSFGFTGSYMRFYAPYRADNDFRSVAELNGMFLIIFLSASLLSLIAGGIITACSDLIFSRTMTTQETGTLKILLAVMTVNTALTFPANVFDMHIASQERFAFQKILIIVTAVLNPAIALPFILNGHGSITAAVCMTLVTAVKLTASAVYCIKRLKMQFVFKINTAVLKQVSVFSFFIFLNIVSDQINWNTDKTILGIFKGSQSVTRYSVASQLNSYFLTFSYALCALLTPRAHTLIAEKKGSDCLTRFFTRFGRAELLVMMYLFMLLIAVGKPFMRLWSGLDSDIPYFTALLLTAPLLVTSAQSIGIEIQRAKDMHKFRSVLYILIAVVNMLISIPLCIHFGEIGCALGTCLGLTAGNIVIMNFYYHRRVGLNMIYFWRRIIKLLPVFVPSLITAVIIRVSGGNGILTVIVGGACITLVYGLSIFFIALSKKERGKILRSFQ